MKRYRVKPDAYLSLKDYDPDGTGDYKKNDDDKEAAKQETEKLALKLGRLQDRLYANGSSALLIGSVMPDTGSWGPECDWTYRGR